MLTIGNSFNYRIIYGLITFLFVISSCSDRLPMVDRINSKDELPDVSIENYKTTYTEDGRIKFKLQAQLAEQYDGIVEPYVDFKKGLSIVLFDKENKIQTSGTADKAVYYQKKETWEATGNVIVTNLNGDIFTTEKLYGDQKANRIFTDKLVKITKSDGTVLYSKLGFESNSEFTIYKFIDVSGIIVSKGFSSDDETEETNRGNSNEQTTKPSDNYQKKPEYPNAVKPNIK